MFNGTQIIVLVEVSGGRVPTAVDQDKTVAMALDDFPAPRVTGNGEQFGE